MAKTPLQAPPIRKDGLQIDEKRKFQQTFWTVERVAWAVFVLILFLTVLGLTGSGGFFATASRTIDTGRLEYPRVSRWEASSEFRVAFSGGAETHRLAIEPIFFEYLEVEGIQPQPERSFTSADGVVMEFAAEQGAPVNVILYYRPLRPGYFNYNLRMDDAATSLSMVVLP